MNDKKMIIRNCPAYSETQGVYWTCYEDNNKLLCQDCTDCVMKQIVELLQQYDKENCNWCEPISFNTENIYELLKIQEVE